MDWKTFELQIEYLIPGILILGLLSLLMGGDALSKMQTSNDFFNGSFLIAASYGLGLLSSYIMRYIIDGISELMPRALVFKLCAHVSRNKAKEDCERRDPIQFNDDLDKEKASRIFNFVAEWNAIYRSALRKTTRKAEVDRRRAQGRLLRNMAIPTVLGAVLFNIRIYDLQLDFRGQLIAYSSFFLAIVVHIFLYAYAEYVNFAEAWDIGEKIDDKKDLINVSHSTPE